MFIRPYEENKKHVFASKNLLTLLNSRRLDSGCILSALDGIFGFSQNTLDSGYYKGTMFVFPLRRNASDLSGSIYDVKTAEELLNSFVKDAVNSLLFLSHIEKIEIFSQEDIDKKKLFSVSTRASLQECRNEKDIFTRKIQWIGKRLDGESIHFISEVEVKTETSVDDVENKLDVQKWLIVKLLKGGSVSETFQSLIQDANMSYCPFVGVACPLQTDLENFKGHVFCALPLPLPGIHGSDSLTNLPVNVNGLFALNQNRSELEWTTWDQPIPNSYTQWNECLLKEALPEAYHLLFKRLISVSNKNGNTNESINSVYRCIPTANVIDRWTDVATAFLRQILCDEFIFTENNGGKWIRAKDAIIESFEKFQVDRDVEQTVRETLKKCNINFAEVPDNVRELLQQHKLSQEVNSELRGNQDLYQSFTKDQKLNLLCDEQRYAAVQGLKLLPLTNGTFTEFSTSCIPVCLVTAEGADIFSDSRNQLVCTEELPDDVSSVIQEGNAFLCHSMPKYFK